MPHFCDRRICQYSVFSHLPQYPPSICMCYPFHEFKKPLQLFYAVLLYHALSISPLAVPPIPCSDNLPAPTNGGITYTGGSTDNRPVGATAEYSCFGPYTLVGVSVRTCGSDGEWSSTPAPGLVGVVECGVGQLQCVSVRFIQFECMFTIHFQDLVLIYHH